MSQSTKKTLINGVAILSFAGILSKVIGMLFRLPLGNLLQPAGYGIYMGVYPTYTVLLSISTAGIPVAISRLVSENVTLRRFRQARSVLRTSLILLACIGAVLTVVMIVMARPFAIRTGDERTTIGFIVLAPSILLVSIMSALRGYMQGRNNMVPTAISQIIEQVGKVLVALPLARLGMQDGNVIYGAAGALLGITISEACALVFMAIMYMRKHGAYTRELAADTMQPASSGTLARQLVRIAIPVTLGSMIVPLAGFIDSATIRVRLQMAGFSVEYANELYGMLTGHSLSLVNVPTALATAICLGLIPIIAAARVDNRMDDMRGASKLGLRLGSLLGFPCAAGMSLLSTEIIRLLYPAMTASHMEITGNILSISALTIFFFTQVQASTGVLQGAGYHKIPVYSLVIGVVIKIMLNMTLVAIPQINVYGAPVASIACYAVSMVINFVFIVRRVGMPFDWGDIIVRPLLATLGMSAAVIVAKIALDLTSRFQTVLTIGLAVVVYCVLIFAIGALRREDMELMPGGGKIEKLMLKLRIWR